MNLYTASIALHVMVAIVGVGLLGAIPITASVARRGGAPEAHVPLLERLFFYTRVSFIVMVLTGILLGVLAPAWHTAYWFRGSFLLLIFVAICHARARAALRKELEKNAEAVFAKIERWGWIMCGAVALIGLLMEVKPF